MQHTRLLCPSLSPGVCSNSCPVSDAIQPSHPLSSPSPPAFSLSQHQGLFQWISSSPQVAKSFGASASSSVLSMNIQGWFPVGLIGLIPLLSKGLSEVFFSTMVWSQTIKKPNQTKKKSLAQAAKDVLVFETEKPKGMILIQFSTFTKGSWFLFSVSLFLLSALSLGSPREILKWLSVGHRAICTPVPSSPRKNSAVPFFFFWSALVVCPGQKSQWRRGTSYAYWPSPDHGCHLQS